MPWSPDCVGLFVKRVTALVVLAAFASHASAGPREQAKRMHDRIAGVPPSATVLDAMAAEIDRRGMGPNGPDQLEHRYVIEDAPFGLVFMEALARIAPRPRARAAGLQRDAPAEAAA